MPGGDFLAVSMTLPLLLQGDRFAGPAGSASARLDLFVDRACGHESALH